MQRNEEQNSCAQLKFAERSQAVELVTEIQLPDYHSEMNKLLWVRPTFLPTSRFVGNGKIEFSGAVCYRVLYVGPDGRLHGAEHEGSYGFSVPLEGGEGFDLKEGIEVVSKAVPDAVVSRVLGPRRLSVRCRLRAHVACYANKNLAPRLQGGKGERLHRLCDAAENGRLLAGDPDTFRLEDDVVLEGEGEVRLIATRGDLMLSEISAVEDGVRCRGEAAITLLCDTEREDGDACEPFTVLRRIPFDKVIALAGAMPDWQALVVGDISGIAVAIEEKNAALTVDVLLSAMGQCEESVLLYRDVFLPGFQTECRSVREALWRAELCGNRHFSVSGERPFSEIGIPADAVILDAVAEAEIKEKQSADGRMALSGELHCHVLYQRQGEYETGEFLIPFRGILETEGDECDASCAVSICRVAPTAEGLRVDAEVELAVRVWHPQPELCLSEAVLAPSAVAPRADLEICYPSSEDSLWSVSKRYGVSPDALAAANGLTVDGYGDSGELGGVRYLLIP